MRSLSVAIMPGFGEGAWHTKRLAGALETLGYTTVLDPSVADVIITHSAGCFFLPNESHSKQIILIDPPYWPGRAGGACFIEKVGQDIIANIRRGSAAFLLQKSIWNWVYILKNLLHTVSIIQLAGGQDFHEALAHKTVAIIRNDGDAWLTPEYDKLLPRDRAFAYYHLPGEHDDCWYTAREHAQLIDSIIREQAR